MPRTSSPLFRLVVAVAAGALVAACQQPQGPDPAQVRSADETVEAGEPTEAEGLTEADLPEVEPFDIATVVLSTDDVRHDVPVYVADTPSLRQRGLMGWESLPEGAGMVFVFGSERRGGFWMLDTLIPLSIAFADGGGEIVAILDMDPCEQEPCPSYDPDVAYRYALEVNQGHFDELDVEPGWTLELSGG